MDGEIPERGPLAVNTAEEMCIKLSGCSYSANMSDGTAVNGTRRGYVPGGTIWANGLQVPDDAPPLTGVRRMHFPPASMLLKANSRCRADVPAHRLSDAG